MSVGSPTAGTGFSSQWRPDNEFETDRLYKTEVIRRRGPWRHLEAVEFATLEWVEWFNNRRLLAPIGNGPPTECEQQYYLAQKAPVMTAGVN